MGHVQVKSCNLAHSTCLSEVWRISTIIFEIRLCYVVQKNRLRHIWSPKLKGLSETWHKSLIWTLFLVASSGHTAMQSNRLRVLHKRGRVWLVQYVSMSFIQHTDLGRWASRCFLLLWSPGWKKSLKGRQASMIRCIRGTDVFCGLIFSKCPVGLFKTKPVLLEDLDMFHIPTGDTRLAGW